mgnify:CR=1 FL=1
MHVVVAVATPAYKIYRGLLVEYTCGITLMDTVTNDTLVLYHFDLCRSSWSMTMSVVVRILFFITISSISLTSSESVSDDDHLVSEEQEVCYSKDDCGIDFSDAFIANTKSSITKQ